MAEQEPKRPFRTLAALALARTAKRVGIEFQDQGLVKAGETLEDRAQESIKQGKQNLDRLN